MNTSQFPTDFFHALADPTRLAVFECLLQEEESSVSALTEQFHVSQPAISQHLAVLKKAGLVSEDRRGKFRYYKAEPAGLIPLFNWLKYYEGFWNNRLKKLHKLMEEIDE